MADAGVPVEAVRHLGIHHGSMHQIGAFACVEPAYRSMVLWLDRILRPSAGRIP